MITGMRLHENRNPNEVTQVGHMYGNEASWTREWD